jgi:hypothetical protein
MPPFFGWFIRELAGDFTSILYKFSFVYYTKSPIASHSKDSTHKRVVDSGHCSEPMKDRLLFS